MSFQICKIKGAQEILSLPVAKIIDYPLEQADYKPYAQARIWVSPEGDFHLRIWSFEPHPLETSSLLGVFDLSPENHAGRVALEVFPDHLHAWLLAADCEDKQAFETLGLAKPQYEYFGGEDEQGIYWGAQITITAKQLNQIWAGLSLQPGQKVNGNLFKICDDACGFHRGSFYPTDFTRDDYAAADLLGEFQIV